MPRGSAPRVGPRPTQTPSFGNLFAIPILACVFAIIVSPLLEFLTFVQSSQAGAIEAHDENRFFWPMLGLAALAYAAKNFSRFSAISWPPHAIAFLAYLGFAGATVIWAYAPEISFARYVQQVMIVTSIVLPALLADRRADPVHGVFLCFAFAILVNLIVVAQGSQTDVTLGYRGYFATKNQLGGLSAIALLFCLNEVLYPGRRRAFGLVVGTMASSLLVLSNSKTALGFALLAPMLALCALAMRRAMRLSPVLLPLSLVLGYFVLSSVSGFNVGRVSYILYGDPTFTGRQTIWDFASYQISQRPLLGWGYRGFWLVGPDAPSVTEAPGWVRSMPNGHSGYYDTLLELGYIGFSLLLIFLATTLHAMGRVMDRDPKRGWFLLSATFFIIGTNGLESSWMRGFEVLWLVFLIVAVETVRHGEWIRRSPLSQRTHPLSHRSGRLNLPGATARSGG